VISCPNVTKNVIRSHYDLSTLFYRLLWGTHIHHGLWDNDETPRVAQLRLTETLAELAQIQPGQQVYDIGCGMGGSSIHLARQYQCDVTGVTISPVQRRWAQLSSRFSGVGKRTRFHCDDAETIEFPTASADLVWSIECTEHLFDKPRFFERISSWLKPGGRVAICAWLEGAQAESDAERQAVYDVCEGFFCPSLGSMEDYRHWMTSAGLVVESEHDWTQRVLKTWEICERRVRRSGVRWLARLIDRNSVLFLDRFETILNAYRTGAMDYGCLIAFKPDASKD
jgi:tocopherol O-methyltransferase